MRLVLVPPAWNTGILSKKDSFGAVWSRFPSFLVRSPWHLLRPRVSPELLQDQDFSFIFSPCPACSVYFLDTVMEKRKHCFLGYYGGFSRVASWSPVCLTVIALMVDCHTIKYSGTVKARVLLSANLKGVKTSKASLKVK